MPRSLCVGFIYTSNCLWRAFLSPTLGRARDVPIVRCWMSGISTLGRSRDAATECWMSGISLYYVHRPCDRLALRLTPGSLWGDSDTFSVIINSNLTNVTSLYVPDCI